MGSNSSVWGWPWAFQCQLLSTSELLLPTYQKIWNLEFNQHLEVSWMIHSVLPIVGIKYNMICIVPHPCMICLLYEQASTCHRSGWQLSVSQENHNCAFFLVSNWVDGFRKGIRECSFHPSFQNPSKTDDFTIPGRIFKNRPSEHRNS
jgi:hypothetical protein